MKGVITAVKGNKAIFLNEFGEFITIEAHNYEVGQTVNYKPRKLNQYSYIAACLVLFMMLSLTGYAYYTPVSYMSIDINPSIQLEINRFNKVIKAVPLNDDAKELLQTVKVNNKDVDQSLDSIIEASKSMGYLNDDNNHVEVDVVTKNDKLLDKVNNHVSKYNDGKTEVAVERADQNVLDLSKEMNISIGRAKAVIEYSNTFGGDVKENASQLAKVPVKEIKKQIIKDKIIDKLENKLENAQEKQSQNSNANKGEQSNQAGQSQQKQDKAEKILNKIEEKIENKVEDKTGNGSEQKTTTNENKGETIKEKVKDRIETIKEKQQEKEQNKNNGSAKKAK